MLDLQHDQLLPSQSGRRSGMFLLFVSNIFLLEDAFKAFSQSLLTDT